MCKDDIEAPGDPDGCVLDVHGRRDLCFGEHADWPRGRWGGRVSGGERGNRIVYLVVL